MRLLAAAMLMPIAALFLRLTWEVWHMPQWQQRELQERRARRLYDQAMIRFWLSGGRNLLTGSDNG